MAAKVKEGNAKNPQTWRYFEPKYLVQLWSKKKNNNNKKVKKDNNTQGQAKAACLFYEKIDAVLGCKSSITPQYILESDKDAAIGEQRCNIAAGEAFSIKETDVETTSSSAYTEENSEEDNCIQPSVSIKMKATATSANKKPKDKPGEKNQHRRKRKASNAADRMESFVEKFLHMQQESEKRFLETED